MSYRGQQQGMRRGGRQQRGGGKRGQHPPQMPHIKTRGGFKSNRPNKNLYKWTTGSRLGVDEDGDETMGAHANEGNVAEGHAQGGDNSFPRPPSRLDFNPQRGRGAFRGGRGMLGNRLGLPIDTSRPSWYKIMLPFCARLTEAYLIQLLRQNTQSDFKPMNFKTEGKQAVFFVRTKEESEALRKVSGTITLEDGYKVKVLSQQQLAPDVESLAADQLSLLKEVMSSRYDVHQRALNLCDLAADDRFRAVGIVLNLCRPAIMKEVGKVITEHIPEVQQINLSKNRLDSLASFGTVTPVTTNLCKLDLSNNRLGEMCDLNPVLALRLTDLNVSGNPFLQSFRNEHEATKSGFVCCYTSF